MTAYVKIPKHHLYSIIGFCVQISRIKKKKPVPSYAVIVPCDHQIEIWDVPSSGLHHSFLMETVTVNHPISVIIRDLFFKSDDYKNHHKKALEESGIEKVCLQIETKEYDVDEDGNALVYTIFSGS